MPSTDFAALNSSKEDIGALECDGLDYSRVDVHSSSNEHQIVLVNNRKRFILIFTRSATPENEGRVEEWFQKIEESEEDPNELVNDKCLEDFPRAAISACRDMISSLSASEPGYEEEPQTLEEFFYPTTFCLQVYSKQGNLQPCRIHDCVMYLENIELVGALDDLLAESTSVLVPATELVVVEDRCLGMVLKVSHKDKICAFKSAHSGNKDQLLREIQILRQISRQWDVNDQSRPSVPQFVGLVACRGQVVGLLEEFIDGVNMDDLAMEEISTSQRRNWKQQVTKAILSLHEHGFVWGDVKAHNILIHCDKRAWLIDFGGSVTKGWMEHDLAETKEGDLQGLSKLVDYLGLRR